MTLHAKEVCEIHGHLLEEGEVPIKYGLISFNPEYVKAKDRYFPNSRSFLLGGCLVNLARKFDITTFCSACRVAEQEWELEFGKQKNLDGQQHLDFPEDL